MASYRVYVPWFPWAISKSLKRNVRPLSRFVWLHAARLFRLVKSLDLADQSSRHRKDTRNKALDRHTEDIAPMGERPGIADALRDDRKRFVVHADEKLTTFVELELAIRVGSGSS